MCIRDRYGTVWFAMLQVKDGAPKEMKKGFLLMPGEEATVIDREAWRKSIEGLTEEEIKWKAWLATRGHDVTITESNVADYCEVAPAGEQAEMARPAPTGLNEFYQPPPLPENPCPEYGCEEEFETPFLLRKHIKACHPPTFPPPHIESWDDREIEDGMGAKYPTYSWRQDTSHAYMRVPVPRGTTAADVVVKLKKNHIFIGTKAGLTLINSKTANPIYVDEFEIQWELEPVYDPYLVIHLTKFFRKEASNCRDASETWWTRCLRETKELSLIHISEPTRPY
eukprot:TRINITY_DN2024_c0_g1_i4.p1 TRINITY_DN2024_c0_g1~~TRINITY_DN2024_c0_g1_i4.p1  ORF type:complete len:282 (-),score=89.81 TRINITY_DN2024_c0_g1_i4:117-962(-)